MAEFGLIPDPPIIAFVQVFGRCWGARVGLRGLELDLFMVRHVYRCVARASHHQSMEVGSDM